jgi:hypothetical protein
MGQLCVRGKRTGLDSALVGGLETSGLVVPRRAQACELLAVFGGMVSTKEQLAPGGHGGAHISLSATRITAIKCGEFVSDLSLSGFFCCCHTHI